MDWNKVGEHSTLEARYTDASGALADPTSVDLYVTAPDGTVVHTAGAGLTHVALSGVYTFDQAWSSAGAWSYRFVAAGTITQDDTNLVVVYPAGTQGIASTVSPWASYDDLVAQMTTAPSGTGVAIAFAMLDVATDLAYRASGKQFPGLIRDVVRPCRRESVASIPGWWPAFYSPSWYSGWGLCACNIEPHRDCGCSTLSEIKLAKIVQAVFEVRVDGAVLSPTKYRIDDHRYLVRTDGATWPCCQDLTADPLTATNTFQVDFLRGAMPPPSGKQAVIDMAKELFTYASTGVCSLPPGATQLNRQGVAMTLIPPTGVDVHNTGIRSWDLFVSAVNPTKASRRASIASPDLSPRYRRVGR